MAALRERIAGRKDDRSEATLAVLQHQLSRGGELDDAEKSMAVLVRTDQATSTPEIAAQLRKLSGGL